MSHDEGEHMTAFALCLDCKVRWFAVVHDVRSWFQLECPQCGAHNSFAAPLPAALSEHFEIGYHKHGPEALPLQPEYGEVND